MIEQWEEVVGKDIIDTLGRFQIFTIPSWDMCNPGTENLE